MRLQIICIICLIMAIENYAQDDGSMNTDDLNAQIDLPTFEARIGIGFNYDLLHNPLDVSFDYPKGYFGMNIPIEKAVNVMDYRGTIEETTDSIIATNEDMFSNMDEFKPTVGARQNPNPSIRVDVPMLGGVASFWSTQNFFLNYQNTLGNPNVFINPDSLMEGLSLLMRGTINVPISMKASWETMSFGYAFEVNRYIMLALNLHRHVFYLDLHGKVDIDILGKINMEVAASDDADFEMPSIDVAIDYPSKKVSGVARGRYEAEVWTPTLALKAWRFSCVSRFGINTKANGSFMAKYALPFFVDPVTFESKFDFEDPDIMNNQEIRQGLIDNAVDSVTYSSRINTQNGYKESELQWEMPTGLTFSFDIIPEKMRISYTKLFGDVAMKLDRIAREQRPSDSAATGQLLNDSLVIDYGITIDHIMVLELDLFHSFLNLGIFSMDLRYADEDNLIGKNIPSEFKLGDAALLPYVSMGSALGTKIQLLMQLDILPLPAVKTGIYYYF